MSKESGKAFDTGLFKRLLRYTKPYKLTFYGVAISAILLSAFAVMTPYLLRMLIDEAIMKSDAEKLLFLVVAMLVVLLAQVIFQLLFNYYANWLGESVIKDVRIKLFRHMLNCLGYKGRGRYATYWGNI